MTNEQCTSRRLAESRIPEFQSREEEATFWDTHDFTEFLDETRPVKLRVRRKLSAGLDVYLDRQDREKI